MTLRLLLILCLIYLLFTVLTFEQNSDNYALEMTFFDVGQGDSIYIKFPNNKRALIDGGGTYDVDYKISKKFVYPFCKFDYIFVTHPHYDHVGGLKKVLQRCESERLTFNDISCDLQACDYLRSQNDIITGLKGDIYTENDVTLRVLWPDIENTNVDYDNVNNLSIVLFLDYGNYEVLFTGDIERQALSQVDINELSPYIQDGLDVYKVPHHGAINGLYKPLLEQLHPKYCVISVGKDNSYGHPHQDTLDFLNEINCKILRTDEIGDITFTF